MSQYEKETPPLVYAAPVVRDYGGLQDLTAGCNDGESLDADFPTNTPKRDLTFSNPCLP